MPRPGDWFNCNAHGMEQFKDDWYLENEYEIYEEVKIRVDD
jgi:hypothetical protein